MTRNTLGMFLLRERAPIAYCYCIESDDAVLDTSPEWNGTVSSIANQTPFAAR